MFRCSCRQRLLCPKSEHIFPWDRNGRAQGNREHVATLVWVPPFFSKEIKSEIITLRLAIWSYFLSSIFCSSGISIRIERDVLYLLDTLFREGRKHLGHTFPTARENGLYCKQWLALPIAKGNSSKVYVALRTYQSCRPCYIFAWQDDTQKVKSTWMTHIISLQIW